MRDNWDPIIPIEERSVPDFPLAALPEPLHTYVAQVAESFQVPAELPGCLVLTVIAASIAKVYEVEISADWREPTNLFTVVVLPSGQRKSPVFREVVRPIDDAEQEMQNNFADLDAATQRPPRLLTDDVTPEELAMLLARNNGRIALMSTEGGAFETMAGRYNRGIPNLDVYLKGYSGDNIRIDRRTGTSEIVVAPSLTIGMTVQPDVLDSIAGHPGFRGRGLLARFLFSLPKSKLGYRKIVTTPITDRARNSYYGIVRRLLKSSENFDFTSPVQLKLDDPAQALVREHQQDIEDLLAPGKEFHPIADWANKLAGNMVRIAAALHCAAQSDNPTKSGISSDSVGRAVVLASYFSSHALVAFNSMGVNPIIDGAKYILRWLRKTEVRRITARNVFQATKGRFERTSEVLASLDFLRDRGYVRRASPTATPSGPGRPGSPLYEINPALYERRCS